MSPDSTKYLTYQHNDNQKPLTSAKSIRGNCNVTYDKILTSEENSRGNYSSATSTLRVGVLNSKGNDCSDNKLGTLITPSRNLQVIGKTCCMERRIGYKNNTLKPIRLPTTLLCRLRTYSKSDMIVSMCTLCKEKFYKIETYLSHLHFYHGMND